MSENTQQKLICSNCIFLAKIPNSKFHKCTFGDKSQAFYSQILRMAANNLKDLSIFDKYVFDENKCKVDTNKTAGSVFPYKFILKNDIIISCEYHKKIDMTTMIIPDALPEQF